MDVDAFAPLGTAPETPEAEETGPNAEQFELLAFPGKQPPSAANFQFGNLPKPSALYFYRTAEGAIVAAVARYEIVGILGGTRKDIRPWCYGRRQWTDKAGKARDKTGWHCKAMPEPRPLYGLPALAARPDAPVLMVEGEKTADAAVTLFPEWVAVTWQGGSSATGKADWTVLAGRRVVIWPDADEPGQKAAAAVRDALADAAGLVAVVDVPDHWPDGWDLADELPDGVTAETRAEMLSDAKPSRAARTERDQAPPGRTEAFGNFVVSKNGVFWRPAGEAGGIFVCGLLRVLACTNDGAGHAWGRLLEWQDDDGMVHRWAMPAAMLAGDSAEIRARLLDGGLNVSTEYRGRNLLPHYLQQSKPSARARVVARLGWHDLLGGRVFVLPDGAVGKGDAGRVMLQTDRPDTLPPLSQMGTLTDWQRAVARLAVGNSRLAFAVSMAFAAPLAGLISAEGGGFHLRGPSSVGKSTALHAAGSVFGGGGLRGWVRSWRATDNGLEGVAAAHCDLPLILDEMGEAAPEAVAAAAYMLANGAGKGRAGRDGSVRRAAEWRVLFLSSGEVGIADRLAEARNGPRQVRAGQEVRVLDVPAEAGPFGMFETLHGFPSAAALADAVKAGAAGFYGVAGREWLEALASDSNGMATAARETIAAFAGRYVPAGADGQVGRAGARFALAAAAGELATGLGILPWEPGEAERAAAACFRSWMDARTGGTGSAEDATMIAAVRRFIVAHGESRFQTVDATENAEARPIVNRAGWRKRDDGACFYLISPEIWKGEVLAGLDAGAAAKVLRARGFLIPQSKSDKRNARMERVGLSKPVRVYAVSDAILEGADHAEGAEP
jgi:putative DNA primase/helicase